MTPPAKAGTSVVAVDQLAWRVEACRCAQRRWRQAAMRDRLRVIGQLRKRIVEHAQPLAEAAGHAGRRDSETLLAEILPVLDACRFLEKRATSVLKPKRHHADRPIWLLGQQLRIERWPHGIVLIVAPGNYKLMLAAIQVLQALAAGNGVVLKPGRDAVSVMARFKALAVEAGCPRGLFHVLGEAPEQAHGAMARGVDHVVFTGSTEAGRAVHQTAAAHGISATMELSGCDASFALSDADPQQAGTALAYGLSFNAGDTCVSPRRLFVDARIADSVISALLARLAAWPVAERGEGERQRAQQIIDALGARGGRLITERANGRAALPAVIDCGQSAAGMLDAPTSLPILTIRRYTSERAAISEANTCPYALAASVFSGSRQRADSFARDVEAGTVLINDLIVPIADPRLPFEGRGASGFGVTRGCEGLLAMTRARSVSQSPRWRRLCWRPLPQRLASSCAEAIRLLHGGGIADRTRGAWRLIRMLKTDKARGQQREAR
jgi:aldehyde dehydrogenase (NAD+)